MKIPAQERERIERALTRIFYGTEHDYDAIGFFQGAGIEWLLAYVTKQLRMSAVITGDPTRRYEGADKNSCYCMGLFNGYQQQGYFKSEDYNEVIVMTCAQALGIVRGDRQKLHQSKRVMATGTGGGAGANSTPLGRENIGVARQKALSEVLRLAAEEEAEDV